MARFIKVQNKIINLDQLAYADFLESGRAMLLMSGLTQEKMNIPLDVMDAKLVRDLLEKECAK